MKKITSNITGSSSADIHWERQRRKRQRTELVQATADTSLYMCYSPCLKSHVYNLRYRKI